MAQEKLFCCHSHLLMQPGRNGVQRWCPWIQDEDIVVAQVTSQMAQTVFDVELME